VRRSRRWRVAVLLAFTAGFTGLVLWLGNVTFVSHDPPFHGKPESEWIKTLKYSDDEQVKEWRAYGEPGVQVLIRGLESANRPGERAYRKYNRLLPAYLRRWLPAPKPDATRSTRMCLVSLLRSLENDAKSATAVMIRTVKKDEADSVRQSAIGYLTSSENENCLLNKLPAREKRALLPALILAIQDAGNWGLRNNAAMALKYYPEQREVVAPVLVNALKDSQPQVRLLAAEALNRIDPDAAKRAGASSIIVAITKNPDDQIAARAVAALGHLGSQPDLAVPALVECLQSTNTLIGCEAVWALEWAPKEFDTYSDTIIPALGNAAQRKDNVGGYARIALAKWTSRSGSNQGAK
jgi:hypothetical protein